MVTWYFIDGNVISLARAEPGQEKGPFLSAPIGRTVSLVVTDWPDVLCLVNPGENWRSECCFALKHIISCVLKTRWIVHLFPRPWLILQVSMIKSCLIITGCSDSPEWHTLPSASGSASIVASFPGVQDNCYFSSTPAISDHWRLWGFVLTVWLAWQFPNKNCWN